MSDQFLASDATALEIRRGETIDLTVTVKRPNNLGVPTAVNISGSDARLSIRREPDSSEATEIAHGSTSSGEVTLTDPTNGVLRALIPSATTEKLAPGIYYWAVRLKEPDGFVSFPAHGTLVVRYDVARTAP